MTIGTKTTFVSWIVHPIRPCHIIFQTGDALYANVGYLLFNWIVCPFQTKLFNCCCVIALYVTALPSVCPMIAFALLQEKAADKKRWTAWRDIDSLSHWIMLYLRLRWGLLHCCLRKGMEFECLHCCLRKGMEFEWVWIITATQSLLLPEFLRTATQSL